MLKNNENGQERKIGLEIEYASVPLDQVADIICALFTGEKTELNRHVYEVKGTELGDFKLELDSIPLQKMAENSQMLKSSDALLDKTRYQYEKVVDDLGAEVVPFEIVCPPIKISQIPAIETLCEKLRQQGAEGTKSSLLYAFGLHLNPELASFKTQYILRHVQTFLLLAHWLKEKHQVDISRKLTSFIDPFPVSYYQLVLHQDYQPDIEHLIRDYHAHNPTRNRALDMLPLFCHLDASLVRSLYGEKEKINQRPTFHYRLPNCEIGQSDWTISQEWNIWLTLEKIANDEVIFNQLLTMWQEYQHQFIHTDSGWLALVNEWMAAENV